MPQNKKIPQTLDLLVSQKSMQRHLFSTLHPFSTVIFATATVLAFVLLHDSTFNFNCYTQREATPTQKSAWKCAATSHDFFLALNVVCFFSVLSGDLASGLLPPLSS